MTGKDYIGTYNPNDLDEIKEVKLQAILLIDVINGLDNTDRRRKAVACTHIEEAAMMAVKSIFSGE